MNIIKIPAKTLHLELPMYRKKATAADQNTFIDYYMKFARELNPRELLDKDGSSDSS